MLLARQIGSNGDEGVESQFQVPHRIRVSFQLHAVDQVLAVGHEFTEEESCNGETINFLISPLLFPHHPPTCDECEEAHTEDETDADPSRDVLPAVSIVARPHRCLVAQDLVHRSLD